MTGYHVLTADGDRTGEVDELIRQLGTTEQAGLHRHFFVTRANQTVVMTLREDSPLAAALRRRPGWQEPRE